MGVGIGLLCRAVLLAQQRLNLRPELQGQGDVAGNVNSNIHARLVWALGFGHVAFGVGALEVFDAAVVEAPETGGYFVDEVVIVGD